jgi:DNA-binding response OmpR family regulator
VRILIADDDADMRKVIRKALEPLSHDIHETDNAIEALKIARVERPDLVILDVVMPGVDGYEICYLIKTAPELQHTRVIMLTVRQQQIDISIGRGALADAYLVKPFNPDKLLAAIAKLEGGKSGPFPTAKI